MLQWIMTSQVVHVTSFFSKKNFCVKYWELSVLAVLAFKRKATEFAEKSGNTRADKGVQSKQRGKNSTRRKGDGADNAAKFCQLT